jgi:polyisoprenoid-binding protein YceI
VKELAAMTLEPGTYNLGPGSGVLSIRTTRQGAASKAGHDLRIEVGSWEAELRLGEPPEQSAMTLAADSRTLRVMEGSGGIKSLTGDDKENIQKTINDEVLKGCAIEFRSSEVHGAPSGSGLSVQGQLDLNGKQGPVTFDLALGDDGRVSGSTVVKQTAFGMKPYSALFGALKVADEVTIAIDAKLS